MSAELLSFTALTGRRAAIARKVMSLSLIHI